MPLALFERCQQSTEFHFDDIETQLTAVEKDFLKPDGTSSLQEGLLFNKCFAVSLYAYLPGRAFNCRSVHR